MNISEFNLAVREMQNVYDKDMDDTKKKVWYEHLKNMPIARFKYILGKCYDELDFLPSLAKILEISSKLGYISEKGELDKESKIDKKCPYCGGTGIITYYKLIKNGTGLDAKVLKYEYAAMCTCNKNKQYKGWEQDDHKSEFYMPYASELGLKLEKNMKPKVIGNAKEF